jgi:hypothetical protein
MSEEPWCHRDINPCENRVRIEARERGCPLLVGIWNDSTDPASLQNSWQVGLPISETEWRPAGGSPSISFNQFRVASTLIATSNVRGGGSFQVSSDIWNDCNRIRDTSSIATRLVVQISLSHIPGRPQYDTRRHEKRVPLWISKRHALL